jgi:hypothetical protein
MKDIYDIVQDEIFNKLNCFVKINSITALSGGTQTISLCINKWVRVGHYLTDNSDKKWLIQSITNNSIVVKKPTGATDLVLHQELELKNPKFLFGTRFSANMEYLKSKGLPLIWLVETISETEYNYGSSIERSSKLRFFLLDENNPKQYINDDYRKNVVTPMYGLKDEFLRVINKNTLFKGYESVEVRPITRFGNENEKGYTGNILDDNLSGLELNITLDIFRRKNCNC